LLAAESFDKRTTLGKALGALRRAHLGCLGSDGPAQVRVTELDGHALPEV